MSSDIGPRNCCTTSTMNFGLGYLWNCLSCWSWYAHQFLRYTINANMCKESFGFWEKLVALPFFWFFWITTNENQWGKQSEGSYGGSCFSFCITCDVCPHSKVQTWGSRISWDLSYYRLQTHIFHLIDITCFMYLLGCRAMCIVKAPCFANSCVFVTGPTIRVGGIGYSQWMIGLLLGGNNFIRKHVILINNHPAYVYETKIINATICSIFNHFTYGGFPI